MVGAPWQVPSAAPLGGRGAPPRTPGGRKAGRVALEASPVGSLKPAAGPSLRDPDPPSWGSSASRWPCPPGPSSPADSQLAWLSGKQLC